MRRIQDQIASWLRPLRLFESDDAREAFLLSLSEVARATYLEVARDAGATEIAEAIETDDLRYFAEADYSVRLNCYKPSLGNRAYDETRKRFRG